MANPKVSVELVAKLAGLESAMGRAVRLSKNTADRMDRAFAGVGASLSNAFAGVVAGVSVGSAVSKLVDVQRQFDVLNASMTTVMGSSALASREFEWISEFAATTPFGLAEVTQAFVKMKALGLDPTEASLRSFGNTASAMGKSLDQFIEAVADASTSQFERLKEFGIKARQEGDKVALTFQGITMRIGNNADEITKYLQKIGDVEFGGAMAERAKTLDGALSNFGDTWNRLFLTISQQGVGKIIQDTIETATRSLSNWNAYLGKNNQGKVDDLVAERITAQTLLGKLPKRSMIAKRQQERIDAINAEIRALQEEFERGAREVAAVADKPKPKQEKPEAPDKPKKPARVKADDLLGDFAKDAEERLKPYEDAIKRFEAIQRDASTATAELTRAEREFFDLLSSPEWAAMSEPLQDKVRATFEAANASERLSESQKRLNDLLRDSALEEQREDMQLLATAFEQGKISAEQYAEAVARALGNVPDELDPIKDSFAELKQAIEGWGQDSAQAIVDFAITGKSSFSDMIESMLADLAKMVIYKNVTGPMASAISSFFAPNAKGGVYDSPSLSAYSNQVYSSPQFFKFANGGVFGEAGPEAIMPLSRGADGKLGVKAQGGGANLSVEIHNYSGAAVQQREVADSRGGRKMQIVIGEAVAGEMRRPGSAMHNAVRQTFGLTPMLTGR